MKPTSYLAFFLGLLAAICPDSAAAASATLELRREQAVESAIAGCSRAIEDSAIAGYMKRRADAGNPATSEGQAREEIESTPWWNDQMLPALRRGCACLYQASLSEMRSARTDEDLNAAVAKLADDVRTQSFVQELDSQAASCFAAVPGG